MKKNLCKKILSCILVLVLVFGSMISTYAYSIQTSNIIGTINFDRTACIDLTGIKLDVYKLSFIRSDEVSSDYAHIYETTVSPDKNGRVKFTRPSGYCYVKVDMDSLPLGFGVNNSGILIGADENTFEISISAIADFSVDFSDDSVDFFDKDKTPLFVSENYKLNYNNDVEQVFLNATKNRERTLTNNINAVCSFGSVKVQSKQSIESLDVTDKIEFLHRKGYITEEERIYAYIDSLESGAIKSNDEISNALSTIGYYQHNNEISRDLNDSITNIVHDLIPEYQNEAVYTNDYFSIHYESGDVSTQNLNYVYLYLSYTKTSLCSTFNFETPALIPGDTTYQVYLVEGIDDYSGLTVPFMYEDEMYTYIIIYYNNGHELFSNNTFGTICHEFTHAVQHQYDATEFEQILRTMHNYNEAVANAVAVRLVPNYDVRTFVYKFQSTPEYSLLKSHQIETEGNFNYYQREYGVLLFPLFLMQEYSDLNTIRQIYEEYRLTNNIYEALDNVLQRSNSSLKQAYATFARFNYDLGHYYDYCQSPWRKTPRLDTINTNSLPYTSQYLSSRYFEITDSSYNRFSITFDNVRYLDYAKLQRVDVVGSEFNNGNYSLFTDSMTTVFNIEPGDKTCFILSNAGLSLTIKYSVRVFSA